MDLSMVNLTNQLDRLKQWPGFGWLTKEGQGGHCGRPNTALPEPSLDSSIPAPVRGGLGLLLLPGQGTVASSAVLCLPLPNQPQNPEGAEAKVSLPWDPPSEGASGKVQAVPCCHCQDKFALLFSPPSWPLVGGGGVGLPEL